MMHKDLDGSTILAHVLERRHIDRPYGEVVGEYRTADGELYRIKGSYTPLYDKEGAPTDYCQLEVKLSKHK